MRVLGLIPARAGSQRVPNKNMEIVGGKTLVERTIDCAKWSDRLDTIAVTTDSWRIATLATNAGVLAISRPEELSRGDQPMMLSVVRHALEDLRPREFDAVCLLQPTSPLRNPADIMVAIEMLKREQCDSVVSVTEGDEWLAFQVRHARRLQPIPKIVVPNGAVFLATTRWLQSGGNWFDGECYAYQMPKDRSLDIDTPFDLQIARQALKHVQEEV